MPMFCRHNRMTAKCPICSRETEAALPSAPVRPRRTPGARIHSPRSRPGLRTQKLARAEDDGYRNPLVPGVRATADAERLARTLTAAALRLEFPGPHPEVAEAGEPEAAIAQAVAIVAGEDHQAAWQDWVARNGGTQLAALTGDPAWPAPRRFGRIFERLGFLPRGARYELLITLGCAGVVELEADALHPGGEDDPATIAAKRILLSGDRTLIERRARQFADAAGVPLGALDHAFAEWERGGGEEGDATPATLRALALGE